MPEGPPKKEVIPEISGVDLFEMMVNKGEWNEAAAAALDELIEVFPEDMYMLYLNYQESGLVDELPEHERMMYNRLAGRFE